MGFDDAQHRLPCRPARKSQPQIVEHALNGALLIEPACLVTNAGFRRKLQPAGVCRRQCQQTVHPLRVQPSRSSANVLRGLHYQINTPDRLVRVIHGEVFERGGWICPQLASFASGPAIICLPPASASCWVPTGLPMVFWWSAKPPSCTKPLIFAGPDTVAASRWNDPQLNIRQRCQKACADCLSAKGPRRLAFCADRRAAMSARPSC